MGNRSYQKKPKQHQSISNSSRKYSTLSSLFFKMKRRPVMFSTLFVGLISKSFKVDAVPYLNPERQPYSLLLDLNKNQKDIDVHLKDSTSLLDLDLNYDTDIQLKGSTKKMNFYHGTTTVAFICKDGIVAAVDSRATLGSFVGSKTTQKVLPINKNVIGTMAGGAADCMFWIRKLRSEAKLYELNTNRTMSVKCASRLLANALYQYRGLGLSIGTMVMGYDSNEIPNIYYVDNSGARIKGDLFAVGSGSTFALGVLDNVPNKKNMSSKKAITLAIRSLRSATLRDAHSGGYIGVYLITSKGWEKVFSEDLAITYKDQHST